MSRWPWFLTVAVVLALGAFVALAPHVDKHDAIIAQHERARDSLVVLAAHKLDSAKRADVRAETLLVRIGEATAARAAILLPPPPALILTAALDSVQINGEQIPVDPRLMKELRALVEHDAGLHRLLSADSLTITRMDALIDLRTKQVRQLMAAATDYKGALEHASEALEAAKEEIAVAQRQKRIAIVAAVVVGGFLLLRR